MNQKNKADLQRKLSMTAVPKPPAGLAERIKADIPHDLRVTQPGPARRLWPATFTLRIAASLVLVIAAAYVAVHLVTRNEFLDVFPNVSRHKTVAAPPPSSTAEVTIDLEEKKATLRRDSGTRNKVAAQAPAAKPAVVAEAPRQEAQYAPEVAKMKDEKERTASFDQAASNVAAPAAPPTRATAAKSAQVYGGIVTEGRADTFAFEPAREVFGLSVDPAAFDRVKQKIDQGQRPAPGTIDVAGLVNYFAGTARAPRHEVRLDVEGSRAPSEPNVALIHFSVETPRVTLARGASVPPIGKDADLTITLNSDDVVSHRLIGADELKSESTLTKNTSVTGVVEVHLLPSVHPTDTVATLRLHYVSAIDGKPRTVTKFVRAWELKRSWDAATHRHRIATLSAMWSESMKGGGATHDVAERAEKLATEAPDDARARELANAASASSRLRSSGPTGSGR